MTCWRELVLVAFLGLFVGLANAESLQVLINSTPAGGKLLLGDADYQGPVRIENPITIEGNGHSIVLGNREGSVITILSEGVRLIHLVIRDSGLNLGEDDAGIMVQADNAVIIGNRIESCLHGIYFRKARGGLVRDNHIRGSSEVTMPANDLLSQGVGISNTGDLCAVGRLDVNRRGNGIHLWNTQAVEISGNSVSHTRDGIYFSFSDNCEVTENRVTDCRYGLHYMYSDENRFTRNHFSRNAAGAALMYSGRLEVRNNEFSGNRGGRAYGLLLQSVDASEFLGNRIRDNTVGLYSENSQENAFRKNYLERNYIALRMGGSSRDNTLALNVFRRNTHRVEINGDPRGNRWSEEGSGNYWDGTTLPDLDGDGVSELPHREADLLGPLRQQFPVAGLLSGSPGLEILSFARSRGDVPGIRAIEDPHPLTIDHD